MRRLISVSRYLIVIPCLGSFIAATALMAYGALEIAQVLGDAFSGPIGTKGAKALALAFIVLPVVVRLPAELNRCFFNTSSRLTTVTTSKS